MKSKVIDRVETPGEFPVGSRDPREYLAREAFAAFIRIGIDWQEVGLFPPIPP